MFCFFHSCESVAKPHNKSTDEMFSVSHFRSPTPGLPEGMLGSSSGAISPAVSASSRNPNSVSGTFLWVQSKRDRSLSGLPKKPRHMQEGSAHGRPTSCHSLTYRYPWNHSHWPIPTFCNPKPSQGKLHIIFVLLSEPLTSNWDPEHCGFLRAEFDNKPLRTCAAENWYFRAIFRSLNATVLLWPKKISIKR